MAGFLSYIAIMAFACCLVLAKYIPLLMFFVFLLFSILFFVIGFSNLDIQGTILNSYKKRGYTIITGTYRGVEQSENVENSIPLYVISYVIAGKEYVVKLPTLTVLKHSLGGIKDLKLNDSFTLIQNGRTGAVTSGMVSDKTRVRGKITGSVFLILSVLGLFCTIYSLFMTFMIF